MAQQLATEESERRKLRQQLAGGCTLERSSPSRHQETWVDKVALEVLEAPNDVVSDLVKNVLHAKVPHTGVSFLRSSRATPTVASPPAESLKSILRSTEKALSFPR